MAAQYSYKTRDALFILSEWIPVEEILSYERFKDYYSKDEIPMLLEQMNKVARDLVAPSNDDGEKNLPRLEDGRIIGPPSWKEIYKQYQQNGWGTSNIAEDVEGPLPYILTCFLGEMVCAASPAFIYYPALTTGAAKLIQKFGSEELKNKFLPKMIDGSWQGCMCITEPHAGTDVGEISAKAYPSGMDGIYKIKGNKIFISAGDGDHVDNFIYLTLARKEGSRSGTKGLSLFVVPRFWIDENGNYSSNDVATISKEDKFGIRGCPTVSLAYGENDNCRGYIVGAGPDENGVAQGMKQMFDMMNGKRIESGLTSTGITANEYWNAVKYSSERIQGKAIKDPTGERIAIINHEDIKRALLLNKSTTEACRALIAKAYFYLDVSENDPDNEKRKWANDRLACLTPICKAYPSDEAWNLLCELIQIYGGYGYTEEYPVARAVRDVKINSIYEGTNYVQSMDLIGRKWVMNQGKAFNELLDEIEQFIELRKDDDPKLKREFELLQAALNDYREIQASVLAYMQEGKAELVPVFSKRILTATAQFLGSYYLLDQALIASQQLSNLDEAHHDYYFYYGKIISARFFIKQVLPNVSLLLNILREADTSVIDAPEQIFNF